MELRFSDNFKWGVSSSGFQFEMGDKYRRYIDPNSDWWHWVRDADNISRQLVSGDLPEDGVNYLELFREDHALAREIGLNTYRLNVEWSRIFPYPTSFIEVDVEHDGLGFVKEVRITDETLYQLEKIANMNYVYLYREIIRDLRSRGFKVILALYHFTLPYWLHNPIRAHRTNLQEGPKGLLEDVFPVEFAKYASFVAWKFGDLVDTWVTFNEPIVPLELGYIGGYTGFPPSVNMPSVLPKVFSNIAIAHALAYSLIKRFDKVKADVDSREAAEVGLIHNMIPAYPDRESRNSESVSHYSYFHNEMILESVAKGKLDLYIDGKNIVRPAALGSTLDWLGIDYYSRIVIRENKERYKEHPLLDFEAVGGYGFACEPFGFSKSGRICDGMGWEMYPEGMIETLELGMKYTSNIIITENGVSDPYDDIRPRYIVNHLYVVQRVLENGFPVKGYLHWALTDNYEWENGFEPKFGLYEVNLLTKARRARKSVQLYKDIVQNNALRNEYLSMLLKFERGDLL
ncbi:MAG: family 1 glycosylhydrolase [Infirmifilum sp.]|jgi:beta-galactosidase|uniref:family 1 glycosylhydrolase n=1 Tax=Infirmifilum TaxID=2856573 RepID=UPI003C73C1AE